MAQILNRFRFHNKDDHRKVTSIEHWQTLKTSTGSLIIQMEKFENLSGPQEPEVIEEERSPLNFDLPKSTMTKPDFRVNLRWMISHEVGNTTGGVDLDKLDQAIQKTNRRNRKEYGGLVYNEETIKFAFEQYKKL